MTGAAQRQGVSSLFPADSRDPVVPLAWWVVAFVLHRAVIVALGFDGTFFWEESYRLLAAVAWKSGWDIPLRELQADPYAGGSLVFAALTAIVTSFTGITLLAVKIVAIAWNAAGLWCWMLALRRIAGHAAAHALGLLWVAAPPVFVVFNTIGLGFHGDTVTVTGLELLLMLRWLEVPSTSRLLLWTIVGGLGVWFCYTSAVALAVMLVFAVAAGALSPQYWPLATAGFAIGLAPWLAYQASPGAAPGASLGIVGETFASPAAAGAGPGYFARLWDLVIHGMPVALYFRDIGIPGDVKLGRAWLEYPWLAVYATAFAIVVASSWRTLARGARSMKLLAARAAGHAELAVALIFPLFLVVLAASNQQFNDYGVVRFFTFRLVVPALAGALATIAIAAALVSRPMRAVLLGACVLLGTIGTVQVAWDGNTSRAALDEDALGMGAEVMGHLVVFRHGTDPLIPTIIDALPENLRARAYRGVGFSYAYIFATRRKDAPSSHLTLALLSTGADHLRDAVDGAHAALEGGLPQVAPVPESPRRDELRAAVDRAIAAPAVVPPELTRSSF
ncbi:MAG TPA: hypothetical protein VGK20_18585 [Candidatus Binatia bacterium]